MAAIMSPEGLRTRGFVGFIPFHPLDVRRLPTASGVYVFVRPDNQPPLFLDVNPGGWWKGKDPTIDAERLARKWQRDLACVYIGKATSLVSRTNLMKRFATGQPVGHWGGRLLWQVEIDYRFAWRETPGEDPEVVEKSMLREFRECYGSLPFANLRH